MGVQADGSGLSAFFVREHPPDSNWSNMSEWTCLLIIVIPLPFPVIGFRWSCDSVLAKETLREVFR